MTRPPEAPLGRRLRSDIQALRAIAVLMVLVYHLWPTALPGGYAGVDVFFVISGYLITAHLLREVDATGSIDLPRFWARRARRLLPAAVVVLVATAIAVVAFAPLTYWDDWLKQIAAAGVYVVNLLLARDAVDYLDAENLASPVQHFWSLSVEEQFYLVWPLLLLAAIWLTRRWMARRSAILVALIAIGASSFALSVILTATNPAAAYFVTPTRAWEFAAGGLLAFVPGSATLAAGRTRARSVIGWLGIGAILATAFAYGHDTPFPGYTALLPVLGTAAVVWAGPSPVRWSVDAVSDVRAVQLTGDASYSLYLWHWPLIVLAPFVLERALVGWDGMWLLILSYVLALASLRLIEEPVRSGAFLTSRKPRVTFALSAVSILIVFVVPVSGLSHAQSAAAAQQQRLIEVNADPPLCFGGAALLDERCADGPLGEELVPGIAALRGDVSIAYDCYTMRPEDGAIATCTVGSERADATRVAVTGDSHGAMLVAGLAAHAEELNWSIDTYVGRGCTWADASFDERCAEYRSALQGALLDGEYDLVITTLVRDANFSDERASEFAAARAAAWGPLLDAGTRVVAVDDNPGVPESLESCVIDRGSLAVRAGACDIRRSEAFVGVETGVEAVELEPRAGRVPTEDLFCLDDVCPMVIGNAVVYRDAHHVTATYIETVAIELAGRIESSAAR